MLPVAMGDTIVVGFDGGKDDPERVLDAAIETVGTPAARRRGRRRDISGRSGHAEHEPTTSPPSAVPCPTGRRGPASDPGDHRRGDQHIEAAGLDAEYVWAFGDPGQMIVDTARERGRGEDRDRRDHHGFFGRMFGDDTEAEVKREAALRGRRRRVTGALVLAPAEPSFNV